MIAVNNQFPVAVADSAHAAVAHVCSPVERALDFRSLPLEDWKEIDAVVVFRDRRARHRDKGGAQIHRNADLIGNPSGLDMTGPLHKRRHADPALPYRPLAIEKRTAVR